ncbi:MAG: ABC transporter permease [Bacteroidota bacterium]
MTKSTKKGGAAAAVAAPAPTPGAFSSFLEELSGITLFGLKFLREFWRPPYEFKQVIQQCYHIGYQSVGIISITGFIMGLVLTLQSQPTLKEFGAESMLPAMVSVSIVREIGPIIAALIFAGKVGSGIGAELGSMKVTEQIDAMEVSATNPFHYLVVTRILATTLMLPILVFYTDAIALIGGYVGVNISQDVDYRLFISMCFDALEFSDVVPATIKTFFFGYAVGVIGCFKGYNTEDGTMGVGKSANSAVVVSMLSVFVLDMLAVQMQQIYFNNN